MRLNGLINALNENSLQQEFGWIDMHSLLALWVWLSKQHAMNFEQTEWADGSSAVSGKMQIIALVVFDVGVDGERLADSDDILKVNRRLYENMTA